MDYESPAFVALVRDAFDHELARSGDRVRAFGAAVAAVTAAHPGEAPAAIVMAVGLALDAIHDDHEPSGPPTKH